MSKQGKDDNSELDPDERLHLENEIEKLKLSAFYGAEFSSNKNMPPEVEREWLDYIRKFEEQAGNVKRITVAERLGDPDFPPFEELPEEKIGETLDKVLELLHQNRIYLDTLAEVSDSEIYRFITEELFQHKIDDFDIEGLNTVFIYEEFHPNDQLDIEQTVDDFITEMLSDDFRDFLIHHLAEQCQRQDGRYISSKEAVEKALSFGDRFDRFDIVEMEDFEIKVEEDKQHAVSLFHINYVGYSQRVKTIFAGRGSAKLCRGELGYWNIESLKIPGFEI